MHSVFGCYGGCPRRRHTVYVQPIKLADSLAGSLGPAQTCIILVGRFCELVPSSRGFRRLSMFPLSSVRDNLEIFPTVNCRRRAQCWSTTTNPGARHCHSHVSYPKLTDQTNSLSQSRHRTARRTTPARSTVRTGNGGTVHTVSPDGIARRDGSQPGSSATDPRSAAQPILML